MKLVETKRRLTRNIPVESMYNSEFVEPFATKETKIKSLPAGKRYLLPKEGDQPDDHLDVQNSKKTPAKDQTEISSQPNRQEDKQQLKQDQKPAEKPPAEELDFDNGIF